MIYTIIADPKATTYQYRPRGGVAEAFYNHDHEMILHGPAETGKTLGLCWKAHLLCSFYPGCQGAIIRKTYKSLRGSVLQTYGRVIEGAPIIPLGKEHPEVYIYPNGSRIWLGGMDNPDKILSSERDFIYVNQCEELIQHEWEMLATRVTGRGAVIPRHLVQLFGDCNPGGPNLWILKRAKQERLKLIRSEHTDNPTLYDNDGNLTEQGQRTLAQLDNLTGVRYKRLRLGEWAAFEGLVYDNFDHSVHVIERTPAEFVTWYLAMDEGYTHPAVILLIGEDGDGRWHGYKEFYERGKLQSDVVMLANNWCQEYNVNTIAVDASAAGLIADLRNNGLNAMAAKGRVLDGIQSIQNRLIVQGDGKPRLTIQPDCINTINEFESYIWKPEKDEPIKENDHVMDSLRYLNYVIGGSWWFSGERGDEDN